MEIPNVIWNKVVYLTGNVFPPEKVEAIIEAAQLPIAPATEAEKQQYLRDCEEAESPGSADTVYSPLYRFISRRNSPPQVDPLVTYNVEATACNVCGATVELWGRQKHTAWHKKVAAAVRQER